MKKVLVLALTLSLPLMVLGQAQAAKPATQYGCTGNIWKTTLKPVNNILCW